MWHPVTGGDSGFATPDPADPNLIWSNASGSGSMGGILTVFDERNGQARDMEVWPQQASGSPAADVKYRFNWEFAIQISPYDHKKVYVGNPDVDAAPEWRQIQ